MPYSMRRATIQTTPTPDQTRNAKENTTTQNRSPLNVSQPSPTGQDQHSRKRHRMSSTQLTRLESVFRKDTHPSKQKKQELADELGLIITVWLQNKRQTVKRNGGSVPSPKSRYQKGVSQTPDKQDPLESPSALQSTPSPSIGNGLQPASLQHVCSEVNLRTIPAPNVHNLSPKESTEVEPLLNPLGVIAPKSPSFKGSSGNFDQAQSPAASMISADEPWQYLSSSPPIPSPSPSSDGESETHEAVRDRNSTLCGKRFTMLEWACDRQAKRRRGASQFNDATEDLDDRFWAEPSGQSIPPALSLHSFTTGKANKSSSARVAHSPDAIHAASLLLNFKYSLRGRKAGE